MPSTSALYEAHSPSGRDRGAPSTRKGQLLRELNAESRSIQVALNQAHHALDHAMKLMEETYQRKRAQIINGHGDTF